jgi:cytochrome c biogenesis protein CcdA
MIRSFAFGLIFLISGWATWFSSPVVGEEFNPPQDSNNQVMMQVTPQPLAGPSILFGSSVKAIYFYGFECQHCQAVIEEVLKPLEIKYGDQLDIRMLEIGNTDYYELLIQIEGIHEVSSTERGIPTLVIGDEILVGEDPIREMFADMIKSGVAGGGVEFPDIPGLDPGQLVDSVGGPAGDEDFCSIENADACDTDAPIFAAYFYQVGCQECSRVEADLNYLHAKYPQLIVEEFNVYDSVDLGIWLTERLGREDFISPALFIGDEALIGEDELSVEAIENTLFLYSVSGAEKIWEAYDPSLDEGGMLERFQSMGWMAVVLAGLVDGLNPCAFATLVFFVSYLTLSGRRGREVLFVGGAFTLGVFLAYLVVGFGFYKVLDLLGGWLQILARWVYAITALLCFVLAFFSFRDFLKARKGSIGDMSMNLPHALRKRINTVIRKGRDSRAYVIGAFVTGIVISFLELACTGQIYIPTIIFVSSIPELRVKAMSYLVLYNLLFITPLVVVFIMAYYGTTSKDLTRFLNRHAAKVKLGMVILFLTLGSWIIFSLLV